jgi:hypothetical protein
MQTAPFKKDIVQAILALFKQIWKPIGLLYLVYFGVAKLVSYTVITALGYESATDLLNEYMSNMGDMDDLTDWLSEKMELFMQPQILITCVVAYLLQFLMMNWTYFFGFKVVNATVKNESGVLSTALKKSISLRLLGFIGVGIGAFILMFASFAIASFLGAMVSPILVILLFPIVLLLNARLWLAFANYALSDVSMGESFEISFHYITWQRASKMIGIGLVFGIGLFFVQLILQQLVLLIGLDNMGGLVMSNVVGYVSGAFTLSVMVAAFSGLYYRYNELEESSDEMEIEDHLVSD